MNLVDPAHPPSRKAPLFRGIGAAIPWLLLVPGQLVGFAVDGRLAWLHALAAAVTVVGVVLFVIVAPRWRYRVHRWDVGEKAVYSGNRLRRTPLCHNAFADKLPIVNQRADPARFVTVTEYSLVPLSVNIPANGGDWADPRLRSDTRPPREWSATLRAPRMLHGWAEHAGKVPMSTTTGSPPAAGSAGR